MATLSALVDRFEVERPAGVLLDAPTLLAQAIAAATYYSGWADLEAHLAIPVAAPTVPAEYPNSQFIYFGPNISSPTPAPRVAYPAITGATEISVSEWALIRPLFLLYIERENSIQLEASRGLGVDVYGRSSSEIAGDITQMEASLPHTAAFFGVITA